MPIDDPKLKEAADAGPEDAAEAELDDAEDAEAELQGAEGFEDDTLAEGEDGDGSGLGDQEQRAVAPKRKPAGIDPDIAAQLAESRAAAARAEERANAAATAEARRQQQADEEAERQRLELMPADEKARYFAEKAERRTDAKLSGAIFRMEDAADRASFEAYCARIPAAARLAADVEKRLSQLRQQGHNVARRVMYRQILGERADKAAEQASDKLRRTAATARERERGRPGAPTSGRRGDGVRRGPVDERAARAKRLENMPL